MVSTRQYECRLPRTMDLMTIIFAVLHSSKSVKLGRIIRNRVCLGSCAVNMFTLADSWTESIVYHILYSTVNSFTTYCFSAVVDYVCIDYFNIYRYV